MASDLGISKDEKIIHRTVTGEINTNRALKFIQQIALAAKLYQDYHILVDIRDTTFEPQMFDLLEIAAECSNHLTDFRQKIAFIIPNTEQRKQVARLFKTCMEAQGFVFRQFFEYDDAMHWLATGLVNPRLRPPGMLGR